MNDQSGASASSLKPGLLQYILAGIIAVAAAAGGIVAWTEPKVLPPVDYFTVTLPALAGAVGILGIGKGIHLGASTLASALGGARKLSPPADVKSLFGDIEQIATTFTATEADVPTSKLPSDSAEAAAPPTSSRPAEADPRPAAEPPAPTEPAAAPPPPPAPVPLTEAELATLRELKARALVAGQG